MRGNTICGHKGQKMNKSKCFRNLSYSKFFPKGESVFLLLIKLSTLLLWNQPEWKLSVEDDFMWKPHLWQNFVLNLEHRMLLISQIADFLISSVSINKVFNYSFYFFVLFFSAKSVFFRLYQNCLLKIYKNNILLL